MISSEENDSFLLIENLFRHESSKIRSHLTRHFGTEHFDLVEDAVQEALIKAMKTWPYNETPKNPTGWLLSVARNFVIDSLRRQTNFQEKRADIEKKNESTTEITFAEDSLKDDQLRMMFACCHPSLSEESKIILTLKVLAGFSTQEIAKALLKNEDAVAKAYARAKNRLKEEQLNLELPDHEQLQPRLESVLHVIYIIFNEGYNASSGEELIKKDLCKEAVLLTRLLLENPNFNLPEIHAMLALMLFQSSRLETKINEAGEFLPLFDQNRSKWDQNMINLAQQHLNNAAVGNYLSEYHLQAAIAYFYCTAENYESTEWKQILYLYNLLVKINPSPIFSLNRLFAFSKVHGAKRALTELENIQQAKSLDNYHLLYAIKAELHFEIGDYKHAIIDIERSIQLSNNSVERTHLENKLKKIQALSN